MKIIAVVLHKIKYSDTNYILKVYSKEQGLISLSIRVSKTTNQQVLQTGGIFRFDCKQKAATSIPAVVDFSNEVVLPANSSGIIKNLLLIFCCEAVLRTAKEGEANEPVFSYVVKKLILLDTSKNQCLLSNFHLLFLVGLSRHLGFDRAVYFENNGESELLSKMINDLTSTPFDDKCKLRIVKNDRRKLLEVLLTYFYNQLDGMQKIKSASVLEEVGD